MNIFEMAATYIVGLYIRHSFSDGNKRVTAAASLVFHGINGYQVEER
jgi:prophage maintenance system killer protein